MSRGKSYNALRQPQIVANEMERIHQLVVKNTELNVKKLDFKFDPVLYHDSQLFILREIIVRFGAFKYQIDNNLVKINSLSHEDAKPDRIYTIEW